MMIMMNVPKENDNNEKGGKKDQNEEAHNEKGGNEENKETRKEMESGAESKDLALHDNKSWNNPRDFAKSVKAILLPQDVLSTFDCRLIELKNQVQCLMEAHLAPMQPIQVNKITSSCDIFSGPYDTQYCMENPEQAFVDYASSRTDKARGKWYTFKPEKNNLGDTYNPSWKSHPNLRWRQPQNSQNNFSNLSIGDLLLGKNEQTKLKRLSKFEVDFKQQHSKMANKIDTVLKAITDRITGALPSDTVKNLKLNVNSTSSVSSARSYPIVDPQCSTQIHSSINTITICLKRPSESQTGKPKEEEQDEKDNPKNINTNPSSPPDPSVSFITAKVCKLNL
nr:MAK10-like protein [Tanacetum cinerariifolium]